jgi:hypothetical protein
VNGAKPTRHLASSAAMKQARPFARQEGGMNSRKAIEAQSFLQFRWIAHILVALCGAAAEQALESRFGHHRPVFIGVAEMEELIRQNT